MTIGQNQKMIKFKHLKETNTGYWKHWLRAMKLSSALFIHAFIPSILTDYASKELNASTRKELFND